MANLPEEVTLLAYHDHNGRNAAPYLHLSLAGAVLVELALNRRISVEDSHQVAIISHEPLGHPVLDDVLRRLTETKARHVPSSWVTIFAAIGLTKQVITGLADQKIVTHDRGRLLGIIPVNRYLPLEADVEHEVRLRLDKAYSRSAVVDVRTAGLAGIISTTYMETVAMPQHKFSSVRTTFRQLADEFDELKPLIAGVELAVNNVRSGAAIAPMTALHQSRILTFASVAVRLSV